MKLVGELDLPALKAALETARLQSPVIATYPLANWALDYGAALIEAAEERNRYQIAMTEWKVLYETGQCDADERVDYWTAEYARLREALLIIAGPYTTHVNPREIARAALERNA